MTKLTIMLDFACLQQSRKILVLLLLQAYTPNDEDDRAFGLDIRHHEDDVYSPKLRLVERSSDILLEWWTG